MSEAGWTRQPDALGPVEVEAPARRRIWRRGVLGCRRGGALVVLSLVVTLFVCRLSPHMSPVEFGLLHRWMALRPAQKPHPNIVMVAIEKCDVDEFKKDRPDDCTCGSIARCDLGRMVERVKRAGAAVVVLDLMLGRPCPVKVDPRRGGQAHDKPLADALAMPGATILALKATTNPEAMYFDEPADVFMGSLPRQSICASPVLYDPGGMVRGVSLIQYGIPSDIERLETAPLEDLLRTFPPLSLAAFAASVGRPCDSAEALGSRRVVCADVEIPVWDGSCIYLLDPFMRPHRESRHALLINWVGPPGTFPTYRLSDVLDEEKMPDALLVERFRNRVVIVGSVVERINTPFMGAARADERYANQAGARTMSGMEIHAHALDTIMQRRFIRPASPALMWMLIFLASLLTAFAVRSMATWPAIVVVVGSVAALFVAAALLMWVSFWVYTAVPVLAVSISSTVTGLWSYARSRQETAALSREAEAREEATATIVHDLKQPLAAISGLATIIEMSQEKIDAGQTSPELVDRIKRQVERALSDIDELLVANPDRGLHVRAERFELIALVRDLGVAQAARSVVHEVEVRAPEQGVQVEGDVGYLARAVSNLMDNAIKYWPDGGTVIVDVRAVAIEVLISVTDQGMGMTAHQQAGIFGRYQRAVPEDVNIPGTGIGLFSVRRIVEAHGGSVEVWSEPGKGSTFTLRLPIVVPPETEGAVGEWF